jgi:hypothetical protein
MVIELMHTSANHTQSSSFCIFRTTIIGFATQRYLTIIHHILNHPMSSSPLVQQKGKSGLEATIARVSSHFRVSVSRLCRLNQTQRSCISKQSNVSKQQAQTTIADVELGQAHPYR